MIQKIKYVCSADYSANSFFPFYDVEKLYNTFLIPENLVDQFEYFDIGNEITIEYNNLQNKYIIAYKFENITIDSKKYLLFYIGRGIAIQHFNPQIFLVMKNGKIPLDIHFNLNNSDPKLFMGLLILSGLYNFAFNDNDNLILKVDSDEFIELTNSSLSSSHNVYTPLRTNSMLFLNLEKSLDGLAQLHKGPPPSSLSIRSLTTKRIKEKGRFKLKCFGGPYILNLKSNNNYFQTTRFCNSIEIKDLDHGKYTFSIEDANNNELIEINYNGLLFNEITFDILDSAESESIIIMNKYKSSGISPDLPRL